MSDDETVDAAEGREKTSGRKGKTAQGYLVLICAQSYMSKFLRKQKLPWSATRRRKPDVDSTQVRV